MKVFAMMAFGALMVAGGLLNAQQESTKHYGCFSKDGCSCRPCTCGPKCPCGK